MATEYKDVIRVTDTEANLLTTLKNGMVGFATDTYSICFKYGGTIYKIRATNSLTNTYIPYNNAGILDDSVIVNTALGIEIQGTCKINTVSHALVDYGKFLVEGAVGTVSYRTAAELLSDLSGDAGAAFDWNSQSLTGIDTLTASGKIECADLDITSISDYNVPYLFVNALSDSPIWIDSGNVGIGTGSCDGKLHVLTGSAGTVTANALARDVTVESNTNGGISVLVPDTAVARVVLGSESDSLGCEMRWDRTNNEFSIGASNAGATTRILYSGGALGLLINASGDTVPSGNLRVQSDSSVVSVGAGDDMTVKYDGTDGQIDTSVVAPSDLKVECGASKTIELQTSVYDDLQFSVDAGNVPPTNAPTFEALTTNVEAYSFDVDDYIDLQCNEPSHSWKEATDGELHLHLAPKTGNSTGGDRFAKFQIFIAMVDASGSDTWTETNQTAELTIPDGTAALTGMYLTFGTNLNLSSYGIGTQIKLRVKRIAATGGTEFADNVFVTQCGCHLEYNTLGSRAQTSK